MVVLLAPGRRAEGNGEPWVILDLFMWSQQCLDNETGQGGIIKQKGFFHSLQNKIWNLPDRSTILRKFIYDKEGKLAKSCRTDPNFAGQYPRYGTYFDDCFHLE